MNGSEKNSVAICLITNRRLTGLYVEQAGLKHGSLFYQYGNNLKPLLILILLP